jgi:asparagine synthase (glutamine-hydrolysing)
LESYYRYWQRLVPDAERRQLFNAATYEAVHEESAYDAFCGVYEGWNHSLDTSEDHMNASFYFELKTFLHGLLLVGDRVGMAHSLETRMPFLDNDLVDFSLQIPAEYKIRGLNAGARVDENDPGKRQRSELSNDSGKAVLREAMRRIIPRTTVQQMKQGFSAPDASWFRGESIDYVNDLLRDPGARIYEFLDPSFVARVLDEHRSARVNRRLLIWSFLSFEWWLRLHIHGEPKPTRIG